MKLVFVASLAGKESLNQSYKKIVSICRDLNHEVFDDYVTQHTQDALERASVNNLKETYKKITAEIKASDAVIAETTQSSLGVGRYIGTALQYHKPILVLYRNYLPRTLVFDPTRLITIKKYSIEDEKRLKEILQKFATTAEKKKLTYRFNFMIDKNMNNYLEFKSKKEGISKADYMRKLISSDYEDVESS